MRKSKKLKPILLPGQIATETQLQQTIVAWLRKQPNYNKTFTFDHPATEGKKLPQYRRLLDSMGVHNGTPDLIFYLAGAKTVFIELKMPKGTLTDNQKIRLPVLQSLGFPVHVIRTDRVAAAQDEIAVLLHPYIL